MTTQFQSKLQHLLTQLQLDDAPAGGSVVVYHRGRLLAAASIGQALANTNWHEQTLALNFSTGKAMLVTLVHILVSQGLIDYDVPIAQYWQDFGVNGKQDISLRDVLSHESGLFDITAVTSDRLDMLDWQSMLAKVAGMSPAIPDGQTKNDKNKTNNRKDDKNVAYSALVSGWILGGLIEAVTKLTLPQALRQYLTEPLAIADEMYFSVPSAKVANVAQPVKNFQTQISAQTQATKKHHKPVLKTDSSQTLQTYRQLPCFDCWQQQDSSTSDTLQINRLYFDPNQLNLNNYKAALVPAGRPAFDYYSEAALQAVIPAANGVASAQALARMYAMLANGGQLDGVRLIRPAVFEQLIQVQNNQQDAVMPAKMQWRLGYHRLFSVCHQVDNAFGHMGYNGSVAWCDPTRQLAVAFVHNFDVTMLTDIRQFAITETILQWVDELAG